MKTNKVEILDKLCYTELVYGRINKKLNSHYSKIEIEKMIIDIIEETQEHYFKLIGKNFYITNTAKNITITVNSHTHRVITVDRISKI
jgi:hypothetical protein